MVLKYGVTAWCYSMALRHGVTEWCYSMMLLYGVTAPAFPALLASASWWLRWVEPETVRDALPAASNHDTCWCVKVCRARCSAVTIASPGVAVSCYRMNVTVWCYSLVLLYAQHLLKNKHNRHSAHQDCYRWREAHARYGQGRRW
jgi:hypothetical protein